MNLKSDLLLFLRFMTQSDYFGGPAQLEYSENLVKGIINASMPRDIWCPRC
jgi:hypothetical protein